MNNYQTQHGRTEWDFWALALKIAVPVGIFGILFFFARTGDLVAIVALVAAATVLLIGLGIVIVLAIMDRANAREDARFRENVKENLVIAQQAARLQNQQLGGLLKQNRDLVRQTSDLDRLTSGQRAAGGLDIDALFSEWEAETVDTDWSDNHGR